MISFLTDNSNHCLPKLIFRLILFMPLLVLRQASVAEAHQRPTVFYFAPIGFHQRHAVSSSPYRCSCCAKPPPPKPINQLYPNTKFARFYHRLVRISSSFTPLLVLRRAVAPAGFSHRLARRR